MSHDSVTNGLEHMDREHFTTKLVGDYLSRRLNPAQILSLHDHADACATCRDMLASAAGRVEPDHISEQDAVDLAAGVLAVPQVSRHLAQCVECRRMVDDLREFRKTLTPEGRKFPWWMLAAAAGVLLVAGIGIWNTKKQPRLVASLRDGAGVVGLAEGGMLTGLPELPAREEQLLRTALASGRIPEGPAAPGNRSPGKLRGAESSKILTILGPSGTREYSDLPDFRWSELKGANDYEVMVFDQELREIARSGKLKANVWRPDRPLPRQRVLTWQVVAHRNGQRVTAPAPPEPSALFEIIPESAAQGIDAARAMNPPSHLLLALLYSREGLREQSVAEIEKLVAANPDSELARSLRQSVASPR